MAGCLPGGVYGGLFSTKPHTAAHKPKYGLTRYPVAFSPLCTPFPFSPSGVGGAGALPRRMRPAYSRTLCLPVYSPCRASIPCARLRAGKEEPGRARPTWVYNDPRMVKWDLCLLGACFGRSAFEGDAPFIPRRIRCLGWLGSTWFDYSHYNASILNFTGMV